MTKPHAADWDSGAPSPAQLKEFFAQIDSGRITKERLQRFLRRDFQFLGLKETREIMGERNFFGPGEWHKYFGDKVNVSIPIQIPWSEDELSSPAIRQDHFLFLGVDRLGEEPLNLPAWHKVYPGNGNVHPKFYWDWYLTHHFARWTCEPKWYLMPVGILEGSNNHSYDRQVAMLPDEYEVPRALERVTANILYHLLNKKYLDVDYWARTRDQSNSGSRVLTIGDSRGLVVSGWDDDVNGHIGIAASRKF